MRLAQVVGNVVSTIKDVGYLGQKLMIVDFLNQAGRRTGEIPFTRIDARTIRFSAKVFGPHGTTLAYELVRR